MRQHAHGALQARLNPQRLAVVLFWALVYSRCMGGTSGGDNYHNCGNNPPLRDMPVHVHRTGILLCSAQFHEGAGRMLMETCWSLRVGHTRSRSRTLVLLCGQSTGGNSKAAKKSSLKCYGSCTTEKIRKRDYPNIFFDCSRASTAGRTFPVRNSIQAPPPVEMWVKFWSRPIFSMTAAV